MGRVFGFGTCPLAATEDLQTACSIPVVGHHLGKGVRMETTNSPVPFMPLTLPRAAILCIRFGHYLQPLGYRPCAATSLSFPNSVGGAKGNTVAVESL